MRIKLTVEQAEHLIRLIMSAVLNVNAPSIMGANVPDTRMTRDEVVARLRALKWTDDHWHTENCGTCATLAAAIRLLEAGSEDTARLDWLFQALPFSQRHRFGGDVVEFRQGIDAAMKAERSEQ